LGLGLVTRWVLGLLLGVGLGLWFEGGHHLLSPPAVDVAVVDIAVAPQRTLGGRLYLPPGVSDPVPAVLLCHGVNSSKDTLAPLAQSLARQGIAGMVFDFGGYGQSYRRPNDAAANITDAIAVLNWMAHHPALDARRFAILGHSMGGTTALAVAQQQSHLRATLLLSIAGNASPTQPANLWWGSGVYEELNPVGDMVAFFQSATTQPTPPDTTVGRFDQGTARRLTLSPTADHALAPYDPQLQQQAIAWVQQAFELTDGGSPAVAVGRSRQQLAGQTLSAVAGMALLSWGYGALVGRWRRGAIIPTAAVIGALPLTVGAVGAGAAVVLLIPWLLGNDYPGPRDRPRALPWGRWALYGGLLYGLVLLAIVSNALVTGSLIAVPSALWGLPTLAQTLLLGLPYDRFHLIRYGVAAPLGMGAMGLLLVGESVCPGIVVRVLGRLGNWGLAWLRQPLRWQGQAPSRRPWLLLPPLLLVLVGILIQQYQGGLLNGAALVLVGRLVGVLVLWPGVVVGWILRSRPFRRLEARLLPSLSRP
jgi:dienelactone hydrolase